MWIGLRASDRVHAHTHTMHPQAVASQTRSEPHIGIADGVVSDGAYTSRHCLTSSTCAQHTHTLTLEHTKMPVYIYAYYWFQIEICMLAHARAYMHAC